MSWISGSCQDNRHWSCTYEACTIGVEGEDCQQFCIDSDQECPPTYPNSTGYPAVLVQAVDNTHQGGGW